MLIRHIQKADDAAVAQLIRTCLEEYGLNKQGTAYFDPQLDHLSTYYESLERAGYFVLEDEGNAVGVGGYAPVNESIAELQKLYVTKNSRGKGYSSQLLNHIFKEAKANDYKQLYLETTGELSTAVSVYAHFGFQFLQAPLVNDSGHHSMDVWMIKDL